MYVWTDDLGYAVDAFILDHLLRVAELTVGALKA
jgi:hypothetical protein